MTEATSITCKQLTNVGTDMLFELKAVATTGETVTIPTTGPGGQISTSSNVKIVSVNNITAGTTLGAITLTYTAASRLFTYTESGKTDQDLRIEFRLATA